MKIVYGSFPPVKDYSKINLLIDILYTVTGFNTGIKVY